MLWSRGFLLHDIAEERQKMPPRDPGLYLCKEENEQEPGMLLSRSSENDSQRFDWRKVTCLD